MILPKSRNNIITLFIILIHGALCEYDLSICDEVFPCQNNGTCTIDPNSSNGTFMCICQPDSGFYGEHCELDISVCNTTENACLHGGKCIDGIGTDFHCQCEPGWTGSVCEDDVNACESNPCQGQSICVDLVGTDDYKCACPFGYTGKNCERKLRICKDNPCQNKGFCLHEDENEETATCYCVPDFHGIYCQFQYDDCEIGPKCFNGGSCIDGVAEFFCSCPEGWFGRTCTCHIDNMTEPECQNNGTLNSSISEIPLYPSVSITEPAIITTRILPISATPLISTSVISETFRPEATVSFDPIPALTISQGGSSEESIIGSDFIESSLYLFTPVMPSDFIKPTDLISAIETLPESLSIILPSPEKSLEIIGVTPTQSETIYDPCPSVSLEGSEGLLMPSSMSLFSYQSPNIADQQLITTIIQGDIDSSPAVATDSIDIIKTRIPSISVEESSELFLTSPILSVSTEVTPTIIAPPEEDIVSGTLFIPQLSNSLASFETPIASESNMISIPFPSVPFLPVSSKINENIDESFVVSQEFSTADFALSPSPSSESAITYMLSPTTSAFPMLSPSEIIQPSSIIGSAVTDSFLSAVQSDLVTPAIPPLQSEEVINASRRSDDVELPPIIITTSLDSSVMLPTASLPIEVTVTPTTTAIGSDISLIPTPTIDFTTPEPTISVPTPPAGNLSDPCLNYCKHDAICNSTYIKPVCTCPFKYQGDQCEIPRKRFLTSSFTGDSFLGYKVPNESINRINVVLRMATSASEGILFYTAVGKVYALIFIQSGHVTLHLSCGFQSMRFVETRRRVDNGFNFTLQFEMQMIVKGVSELHCVGQVSVNESYIMRGEQIVGHNGIYENPTQLIYVGGVGSPNAYKNDELIGILPGFRGCLYKLMINAEEKDLFDDAVEGKEVSECSAFACVENPCVGTSKCIDSPTFPFWKCICSPGFQGVKCQIRVCDSNLNPCKNGATCTFSSDEISNHSTVGQSSSQNSTPICLCPLGFSSQYCDSKINITKPSFKPLGFDYSAFIAYEPIPRFVDWLQLKLHFIPTNYSQISLLLFMGDIHGLDTSIQSLDQIEDTLSESVNEESLQLESANLSNDHTAQKVSDFFFITYVRGFVTLTWNLGSGTQRIISPSPSDPRLSIHTIYAGRFGRKAWIKLDGMRNITGKSPGTFHRLNVKDLYLGGYESFRFEGLPHDLPIHKGFEGCIFDFGFRVKNRLYLPRAIRGRNIKNCYEEDC